VHATPLSHPALRQQTAPVVLLLVLAGPAQYGYAQQNRDPFDVQRMRPATPSSFWEGARATCAAPMQVPDPLRLADAVDIALCNNPQTRESWANAKVQAAQVGIARGNYLPSVDGAVVLQRIETRNTSSSGGETDLNGALTFNYLLFDFGGRDATLEQARQSLLAADWSHNAALQNVLLNAVQAYYQLYATQEAVASVLAAEKASLNSLDATRARQRAGTATRADVLQAQTAYAQSQLNRTQAQGDAATARGVLANTLGLSAEQPLGIAPPPDLEARQVAERAVSQLIETARARRPDLAAAQAQVRAAQSNIKVQESAGKPTVSLFAGLGATASAPGLDPGTGSIGLQVRIPLFTGYQSTYQILQAREQLEVQTASRDRLATDVSLDVWRAYQDLQTQGQSLTTTEELVASAQESYNAALARYKAGVGTIIDLLNAQSALASAQLQRIQARYRWNVAKVTLARAIGVLDPALLAEHTPTQPQSPAR
jgi:TolC family type I secretion outer membrane protein